MVRSCQHRNGYPAPDGAATRTGAPVILANDLTYEARYGWTPKTVFLISFGIGLGSVVLSLDGSIAVRLLLAVPLLLAPALILLVTTARRRGRLALRVDHHGVTFRGARDLDVPWSDLEAILVFEVGQRMSRMSRVGLQRRAQAPPLPGSPTPRTAAVRPGMIDDVPEDVVDLSLPVNHWRLDVDAMAAAVARYASNVKVKDLTRWVAAPGTGPFLPPGA